MTACELARVPSLLNVMSIAAAVREPGSHVKNVKGSVGIRHSR
jgi:hypothetical protein